MLKPSKKSDYKSLYLGNFDRKYLDNNNKNMEILNIKHIIFINDFFISKYTIFTKLNLGI